jgi:hypothetical protein
VLKSLSLIVLFLVLAGCSDGDAAAPTPSTPPKVTHSVAVNKDRDADAAVAALSKIGPCKLLDPLRAKAPGVPVTTRQVDRSATECYVGELRIDVAYKSFRYLNRWQYDRVALAGASAYLQTDDVTCDAQLPISFEHTIRIYSYDVSLPWSTRCAQVKAFATAAVGVLANTGLLYRQDEPDVARVGSCVDLSAYDAGRNCLPSEPVDVPSSGRDAVVRQIEADPFTLCAIAVDAVRDRLDADLKPSVVDDRQCAFGSPARQLAVSFDLIGAPLQPDAPRGPNDQETKVGDRTAWFGWVPPPSSEEAQVRRERREYVAVGDDHYLVVTIAATTRGMRKGLPLNLKPADQLQALTADVVNRYL